MSLNIEIVSNEIFRSIENLICMSGRSYSFNNVTFYEFNRCEIYKEGKCFIKNGKCVQKRCNMEYDECFMSLFGCKNAKTYE